MQIILQSIILQAVIISLLIVMLRRSALRTIKNSRIVTLSKGFNADYVLPWASLFFIYAFTNNLNLSLFGLLVTIILRYLYTKLFFMFSSTHPVADVSLFLWSYIMIYLIMIHNTTLIDVVAFR